MIKGNIDDIIGGAIEKYMFLILISQGRCEMYSNA